MGDARDPFVRLLDEHGDFIEKLSELEATLDEMVATLEVTEENRILLDEAIRFFEEELIPHFRREEQSLLPLLEAKLGRFGSLVNVVQYEHDEIRREIGKIKEARAALDLERVPSTAIHEMNRHGVFTIQFLGDHFRKERASLFPTARAELSPEDLEAIRARLAA